MPALLLTEVRGAAAAALAPQTEDDPPVLVNLVDAVTPPALMLEWADPWLVIQTVTGAGGLFQATLNVVCFAGRLEPGPGVDMLEALVELVLLRLHADTNAWALSAAQAPRQFVINGVPLLGLRLSFQTPVSIGGP